MNEEYKKKVTSSPLEQPQQMEQPQLQMQTQAEPVFKTEHQEQIEDMLQQQLRDAKISHLIRPSMLTEEQRIEQEEGELKTQVIIERAVQKLPAAGATRCCLGTPVQVKKKTGGKRTDEEKRQAKLAKEQGCLFESATAYKIANDILEDSWRVNNSLKYGFHGDVTTRYLSSMLKGYAIGPDGKPLNKEEELKKARDEKLMEDWQTEDWQKRAPYLDNIIDELLNAKIEPQMFEKHYLKENAVYVKRLNGMISSMEDIMKDERNRPYFEQMDPARKALLDAHMASDFNACTTLSGVAFTKLGLVMENRPAVEEYNEFKLHGTEMTEAGYKGMYVSKETYDLQMPSYKDAQRSAVLAPGEFEKMLKDQKALARALPDMAMQTANSGLSLTTDALFRASFQRMIDVTRGGIEKTKDVCSVLIKRVQDCDLEKLKSLSNEELYKQLPKLFTDFAANDTLKDLLKCKSSKRGPNIAQELLGGKSEQKAFNKKLEAINRLLENAGKTMYVSPEQMEAEVQKRKATYLANEQERQAIKRGEDQLKQAQKEVQDRAKQEEKARRKQEREAKDKEQREAQARRKQEQEAKKQHKQALRDELAQARFKEGDMSPERLEAQRLHARALEESNKFKALNKTTVYEIEGESNTRSLSKFFYPPVTKEIDEKNKARARVFSIGGDVDKLAEFEEIFDEFLSMDISMLKFGSDDEMFDNFAEKKMVVLRGMEIENLVGLYLPMALKNGISVDVEKLGKLKAKADALVMVSQPLAFAEDLMSRPEYAQFSSTLWKDKSADECLELMGVVGDKDLALKEFLMAVFKYKAMLLTDKDDRGLSIEQLIEKYSEPSLKKYEDLVAESKEKLGSKGESSPINDSKHQEDLKREQLKAQEKEQEQRKKEISDATKQKQQLAYEATLKKTPGAYELYTASNKLKAERKHVADLVDGNKNLVRDNKFLRAGQAFAYSGVSEEADKLTLRRISDLCSGEKDFNAVAGKHATIDLMFDEFLGMDISLLQYSTDEEMAQNYEEKRRLSKRGQEINLLIELAIKDGMEMKPTRLKELRIRASMCEEAEKIMANREELITSPYYHEQDWESMGAEKVMELLRKASDDKDTERAAFLSRVMNQLAMKEEEDGQRSKTVVERYYENEERYETTQKKKDNDLIDKVKQDFIDSIDTDFPDYEQAYMDSFLTMQLLSSVDEALEEKYGERFETYSKEKQTRLKKEKTEELVLRRVLSINGTENVDALSQSKVLKLGRAKVKELVAQRKPGLDENEELYKTACIMDHEYFRLVGRTRYAYRKYESGKQLSRDILTVVDIFAGKEEQNAQAKAVCSKDKAEKHKEIGRYFDKLLSFDKSKLSYGTDSELLENYLEKRDFISKTFALRTVINEVLAEGMEIPLERQQALLELCDIGEDLMSTVGPRYGIMKSPYYTRLSDKDVLNHDSGDLMAFPMETNERLEKYYKEYTQLKMVMETGYIDRNIAIDERIPIIKENRLVTKFSRDNPAEMVDTVLGLVHMRSCAPDLMQPYEDKSLDRILPTLNNDFMKELQKKKLEVGRQLQEAYDSMPREMSEDEKRLRLKYSEIGYKSADFISLFVELKGLGEEHEDIVDLFKEAEAKLQAESPKEYEAYSKAMELMNLDEEKFRSKSRQNRVLHMKVITDGDATSVRMSKAFKRSDMDAREYQRLSERALLEENEDKRLFDEFAMENRALIEKDVAATAVFKKFKEYQNRRKHPEQFEMINIPSEIVEEPVITIVHSKSKAAGEKEKS